MGHMQSSLFGNKRRMLSVSSEENSEEIESLEDMGKNKNVRNKNEIENEEKRVEEKEIKLNNLGEKSFRSKGKMYKETIRNESDQEGNEGSCETTVKKKMRYFSMKDEDKFKGLKRKCDVRKEENEIERSEGNDLRKKNKNETIKRDESNLIDQEENLQNQINNNNINQHNNNEINNNSNNNNNETQEHNDNSDRNNNENHGGSQIEFTFENNSSGSANRPDMTLNLSNLIFESIIPFFLGDRFSNYRLVRADNDNNTNSTNIESRVTESNNNVSSGESNERAENPSRARVVFTRFNLYLNNRENNGGDMSVDGTSPSSVNDEGRAEGNQTINEILFENDENSSRTDLNNDNTLNFIYDLENLSDAPERLFGNHQTTDHETTAQRTSPNQEQPTHGISRGLDLIFRHFGSINRALDRTTRRERPRHREESNDERVRRETDEISELNSETTSAELNTDLGVSDESNNGNGPMRYLRRIIRNGRGNFILLFGIHMSRHRRQDISQRTSEVESNVTRDEGEGEHEPEPEPSPWVLYVFSVSPNQIHIIPSRSLRNNTTPNILDAIVSENPTFEELELLSEFIGYIPRRLDQSTLDRIASPISFDPSILNLVSSDDKHHDNTQSIDQSQVSSTIDSISQKKLNIQCTICLNNFFEKEAIRRLPCLHIYHQTCIDKWLLLRRGTCPICRMDFTSLKVDDKK